MDNERLKSTRNLETKSNTGDISFQAKKDREYDDINENSEQTSPETCRAGIED